MYFMMNVGHLSHNGRLWLSGRSLKKLKVLMLFYVDEVCLEIAQPKSELVPPPSREATPGER